MIKIIEKYPVLTKEQKSTLKKYELHFEQINSDYISGLTSEKLNDMKKIYEQLGYRVNSLSCNSCVYDMVRTLKNIYEYNKKIKNKNEK